MVGQNYGVSRKSIETAENELGILFPDDLKRHWRDVGCGRILNGMDNDNLLFSPAQVCAFRRRAGKFKGIPKLAGEKHRICFFMENIENFYSIDLSDNHIYVDNVRVANSLEEFVRWMGG